MTQLISFRSFLGRLAEEVAHGLGEAATGEGVVGNTAHVYVYVFGDARSGCCLSLLPRRWEVNKREGKAMGVFKCIKVAAFLV
jgi:hypothetical protein